MRYGPILSAFVLSLSAIVVSFAAAQESDSSSSEASPPNSAVEDAEPGENPQSLSSQQEGVAMRYQRFENTMLQVAEYLRKTDPERAELLVRAIGKSKENRLPDQFSHLVTLLKQDQLGDAISEQEHVVVLMQGLLELLQSEDRKDEIEKEKARLRDLILDMSRLIDQQTDLRSDTERKENPQRLEKRQEKITDNSERLIKKIDRQDAAKAAQQKQEKDRSSNARKQESSEAKPEEQNSPEGQKKSENEAEKKPENEKPSENEQPNDSQNPSDQQSQEGNKSSENQESSPKQFSKKKPEESSPQPSEKSPQEPPPNDHEQQSSKQESGQPDDSKQQPKTPGREELQRAKEQMERAIEELKKKNHNQASNEQDQAIAELMKAKEKLEEILRQLREEERDLMLAALEARFRDMLARQLVVYNGTVGLFAVPEDQRTDRHRNRSVELARAEEEISLLAAKALTLLKEEGSSVAFPEAVEQMRDDMLTVVQRLERFEIAELTQGIERDIIESLEELIAALQKEIEKSKDKQQNSQQKGQQAEPALVDKLAELKTLRALQYRVNRRTKILGREVEGEQAVDPDIVKQLREQARRQEKIQQATYDLATGRNQ